MDLTRPWPEYTFVAFDTETSGAYPVGNDIVEFGAAKWKGGEIIDKLQLLIKPREQMTDFIIGIHGITNEMVESSPKMQSVLPEIRNFLEGSVLMAHHAPFDLGFLAFDLERFGFGLLNDPVLCTSLLARRFIDGVENHKLQTLVKYLKIDGGAAHRAYDDAVSCLHVGIHCMEKIGTQVSLEKVIKAQLKDLSWKRYSLKNQGIVIDILVEGIMGKRRVDISYEKAKKVVETRQVFPLGLVRNPDGDYLQAICQRDHTSKRFYVEKIKDAQVLYS